MSGSQPLCAHHCLRLPSLIALEHRRQTRVVGPVPSTPPALALARQARRAAASVETRARARIATEAMLGKFRTPVRGQQALGFDVPLLAAAKRLAPRRTASMASELRGRRPEPETAQIVK
jgi:hypothetical protein